MTRIAAYLLLGLGLTNCSESNPDPAESLVGKWEQLTVHTVYHDRIIKQLGSDQWVTNEPGSVWLELAADGSVHFMYNGVALHPNTTYTYRAGKLTFRDLSVGETVHPVIELSDHRLIYRTHAKRSTGTEDITFTYQR